MPSPLPLLVLMVLISLPPAVGIANSTASDTELADEVLHSCTGARTEKKTQVSFTSKTTLTDLVTWAMSFSCKNFLYRSELALRSPKVDIVAPATLSRQQSWRLFLVALDSLGLTVVKKGPVLHVVESIQGMSSALPIRHKSGGSEQLERLLLRPTHLSLDDAKQALSALLSRHGALVSMPSAGAVLVTDYGSHTARMMQLLQQVDQPGTNESLFSIPLKYAEVEEVKQHLTVLLATSDTSSPTKGRKIRGKKTAPSVASPSLIVGDSRTRTILMRASEATYKRALPLIRELDRALESDDTSRMYIYNLEHADAATLAATLASIGKSTPPTTAPRTRNAAAASPTAGATIAGDVRITADVETNSLLVQATRRDYMATKTLIDGLDHARPQVFLEVTILEVDLDKDLDVGGSFHLGSRSKNTTRFGGSQQAGSRTVPLQALQQSTLQNGLVLGALGKLLPTEQFLGISIPSFGVLFQALAEDKRIDIISSPQILTTNNTKAKLSVGQNVPYNAGQTVTAAGVSENIQRQDVQMTLEVTPHVNTEGLVRLDLELNMKELLPNQAGVQPSWTTREIVNTVVVADRESIAIGGLASEQESFTNSKVPLLGDIPLLGVLFRSTSKRTSKRSLLVLITPHVLTDASEAQRLTARKLTERDAFLRVAKSLRKRKFDPTVDYAKKRGFLADINRAVLSVEEETKAIRTMQGAWREPREGRLDTNSVNKDAP